MRGLGVGLGRGRVSVLLISGSSSFTVGLGVECNVGVFPDLMVLAEAMLPVAVAVET